MNKKELANHILPNLVNAVNSEILGDNNMGMDHVIEIVMQSYAAGKRHMLNLLLKKLKELPDDEEKQGD